MSKPTDINIQQVATSFTEIEYRTPIKFGGRVVANATLFNVDVDVETNDGRRATGHGSMPLGNAWGWPSQVEPGERTLNAMIALGKQAALLTEQYNGAGHPIEIMHDLTNFTHGPGGRYDRPTNKECKKRICEAATP